MARKLGIILIAAGIIGAYSGWCNLNNACETAKELSDGFEYKEQTIAKRAMEIESNPLMEKNEIYGGLSAAVTLASVMAIGGGGYLMKKKRWDDLD
jgi:hypothetical protein